MKLLSAQSMRPEKTIRQSHPNDKDINTDENGAYSTMFFQATNDFNSYLQLIHV